MLLPKRTKEQWSRMTDENNHQIVRVQIAEWLYENVNKCFGMYVAMYFDMYRYNHELHNIPRRFLEIECAVTDAMLKELEEDFKQPELAKDINECL